MKKDRDVLKKYVIGYLSERKCVRCGEADPTALEFDHIDPSTKRFTISQGINQGVDLKILIEEIKKTQILCANCHRKKTAKEQRWYKTRGVYEDSANPTEE